MPSALCEFTITARDFGGITLDQALIAQSLVAEGHGCVALVIRRNIQPFPDLAVMVDGAHQVTVKQHPMPRVCAMREH